MKKTPRECPCHSGLRYADCCAPFHRGAEAETATALMRSRYAAFALGDVAYLWKTLAAVHEDRRGSAESFARDVRNSSSTRYLGLTILDADDDGAIARVLFVARVFERGQDRSFAELSRFVREGAALRYASGVLVPRAKLPADLTTLTLATFPSFAEA